jgi:hypothetical protein
MDVYLLDWPGCGYIRIYFAVSEEIISFPAIHVISPDVFKKLLTA